VSIVRKILLIAKSNKKIPYAKKIKRLRKSQEIITLIIAMTHVFLNKLFFIKLNLSMKNILRFYDKLI
jgi:hypothetical protein